MSCPNRRSGPQRYTYLLIFLGVMAIINYWYLILRYWWVLLIIGIIVKLIVDDANKGKQTRSVGKSSIRTPRPVRVVENISSVIAAYRFCFNCGLGYPVTDQFQHKKCPNCKEIHHISNNIKQMHYKMIAGILNNCHKCNVPLKFQDQFWP